MKQIKVKNQVGSVSLVGFIEKEFPMKHGNYFSLGGYHVLNMWHENLEHLNSDKEYLDAILFGERNIVIVDESIPEDYLNDDPCFTGGSWMTPEDRKELYDFMYPRFSKLKCMCCSTAGFKSVHKHSGRTNKSGISLSQGKCGICSRDVLRNNDTEIDQDTWDKLLVVYNEAPSEAGMYLAPWRTESMDPIIVGDDFVPNKKLLSRYATKIVNKDFYGMIKIDDLKEEHKPKKEK